MSHNVFFLQTLRRGPARMIAALCIFLFVLKFEEEAVVYQASAATTKKLVVKHVHQI